MMVSFLEVFFRHTARDDRFFAQYLLGQGRLKKNG